MGFEDLSIVCQAYMPEQVHMTCKHCGCLLFEPVDCSTLRWFCKSISGRMGNYQIPHFDYFAWILRLPCCTCAEWVRQECGYIFPNFQSTLIIRKRKKLHERLQVLAQTHLIYAYSLVHVVQMSNLSSRTSLEQNKVIENNLPHYKDYMSEINTHLILYTDGNTFFW